MKIGIVVLGLFLSLIFYNFLIAQKALKEQRTSVFRVENISYPESVSLGSSGSFNWQIVAPAGLSSSFTTIFWDYESTPSALTESDSPQAVGYPNHPPDYETGEFPLPLDFQVAITPDRIGKVYFRSYALVQGRHLWSEESSFTVVPNGQ